MSSDLENVRVCLTTSVGHEYSFDVPFNSTVSTVKQLASRQLQKDPSVLKIVSENVDQFCVGEHVERRQEGKPWGMGYVTSVRPLKVDGYVVRTVMDRGLWAEVRHVMEELPDTEPLSNHLELTGRRCSLCVRLVLDEGYESVVEKMRMRYEVNSSYHSTTATHKGEWAIVEHHFDDDNKDYYDYYLFHIPSYTAETKPLKCASCRTRGDEEAPRPGSVLSFPGPLEANQLLSQNKAFVVTLHSKVDEDGKAKVSCCNMAGDEIALVDLQQQLPSPTLEHLRQHVSKITGKHSTLVSLVLASGELVENFEQITHEI